MRLRDKLERLERRAERAICPTCHNTGGRRFVVDLGDEPLDLRAATACPGCGRCPPSSEVKIIDVSDVYNLGLAPDELELAKVRITGCIRMDAPQSYIEMLRAAADRERARAGPVDTSGEA